MLCCEVERLKFFGCPTFDDAAARLLADWLMHLQEGVVPSEVHLSDCAITTTGFLAIMKAVYWNDNIPAVHKRLNRKVPMYCRMENNYIDEKVMQEWADVGIIVLFDKAYRSREQWSSRKENISGAKMKFVGRTFQQKSGRPPAPQDAPPPKRVVEVWRRGRQCATVRSFTGQRVDSSKSMCCSNAPMSPPTSLRAIAHSRTPNELMAFSPPLADVSADACDAETAAPRSRVVSISIPTVAMLTGSHTAAMGFVPGGSINSLDLEVGAVPGEMQSFSSASRGPPTNMPVNAANAAGSTWIASGFNVQDSAKCCVFVVDIWRSPNDKLIGVLVKPVDPQLGLGIKDDQGGLKVKAVDPQSPLGAWNSRCAKTFPDDEVRENDVIIRVNGIGPDQAPGLTAVDRCRGMTEQLCRHGDVLLILQRAIA